MRLVVEANIIHQNKQKIKLSNHIPLLTLLYAIIENTERSFPFYIKYKRKCIKRLASERESIYVRFPSGIFLIPRVLMCNKERSLRRYYINVITSHIILQ